MGGNNGERFRRDPNLEQSRTGSAFTLKTKIAFPKRFLSFFL